jgi:hypothetical protein
MLMPPASVSVEPGHRGWCTAAGRHRQDGWLEDLPAPLAEAGGVVDCGVRGSALSRPCFLAISMSRLALAIGLVAPAPAARGRSGIWRGSSWNAKLRAVRAALAGEIRSPAARPS